MERETCQLALNAVIIGLLTYFWLQYLTWELTRKKQPSKWYERPITELFSQLVKKINGLRKNSS